MSGSTHEESITEAQAIENIAGILGEADTGPEPEEVEDAPESEVEETEEEEITEESEESEEESEETEEEAEDAEPEEAEEDTNIESLSDLAEALDVPLEELQANLKTKIKVQGEDLEVTLAELTQGYQKDADYRKKTSELAEHRKQFESEAGQRQEQLNQGYQHLGQLMQYLQNKVVQAPDPQEMAYLKQTDPAQWAVKNAEYREAQQEFQQLNATALQAYQQLQAQQNHLQQQAHAEAIQKAQAELPNRVPNFNKDALDSYLTSEHYGYSPQELAQISDPRLIEIIDKARQFDEQTAKAAETTKKVKKLPTKVSKPSQARVKPKASNLTKAKQRLAKTGKFEDAVAGIRDLI